MSSTKGQVIKCRAAVAWKADSGVSIEEVNVAPPKAHEVRIKMIHTALCHTDQYTMGGTDPQAKFPFIPGHEGAGIVESVGEGVEGFAEGDHVIPLFIPQCKKCDYCKNPRTNICQAILQTQSKGEMPDGTTRFTFAKDGTEIYHFMGCSCFSQYTVVADISLCKINPKAPMDRVCILGCGISTGYGAAINTAQVKEGSTVGVWGLGPVGLAAVMGAKKCGAKLIVGIDKEETKFDLARNFGATDFVNPEKLPKGKEVADVLCELFNDGFDYTFEAVGQAATMRQALESCHKGWGISVIIGVAGKGDDISTAPKNLVNGRTWKGTAFGHWKSVDSVPKLVEEYLNGEMDLDSFVTQHSPLDDLNRCFKDQESGNNLRIVFTMWPEEKTQ